MTQDATRGRIVLKLYIAGMTREAKLAISQLEQIAKNEHEIEYVVEVIDVLEKPELAEQERIMATPTLVKELPPPMRRVIGDLADLDRALVGLELVVRPTGSFE